MVAVDCWHWVSYTSTEQLCGASLLFEIIPFSSDPSRTPVTYSIVHPPAAYQLLLAADDVLAPPLFL